MGRRIFLGGFRDAPVIWFSLGTRLLGKSGTGCKGTCGSAVDGMLFPGGKLASTLGNLFLKSVNLERGNDTMSWFSSETVLGIETGKCF